MTTSNAEHVVEAGLTAAEQRNSDTVRQMVAYLNAHNVASTRMAVPVIF